MIREIVGFVLGAAIVLYLMRHQLLLLLAVIVVWLMRL